MNLNQRISVVTEAVSRVIHAKEDMDANPDNLELSREYNFLRNQFVTLLQVELGAELLTLGKVIALLEVGKVDAAHRILRARAKELR